MNSCRNKVITSLGFGPCNWISIRTFLKKRFTYESKYEGKFDYHDRIKYPKSMSNLKEEELLDEIHSLKRQSSESPSPFHIVKRIKGTETSIKGWHVWVTLRRLDLHSRRAGDLALVPNTPQFNALIAKVKHLLVVKPARFADGRIPSEDDIGALKICPDTGAVTVDEKLRLQSKRLYEKPDLWRGNYLRYKLRSIQGIHSNHYLGRSM